MRIWNRQELSSTAGERRQPACSESHQEGRIQKSLKPSLGQDDRIEMPLEATA